MIDYTQRQEWMPGACIVRTRLISFPHSDVGMALGCECGGDVSHLRELIEKTVDQSGIRAGIGDVVLRKRPEAPASVIH